MFYEDSGFGGNEMSFAQLEKAEAEKSSKSLMEVDNKLYTPSTTLEAITNVKPVEDNIRRYYSEGYDANYEGVEDAEIRQWQQSSFSYIRVVGNKIDIPLVDNYPKMDVVSVDPPNHIVDYDNNVNNEYFLENLDSIPAIDDSQLDGWIITGRSIPLKQKVDAHLHTSINCMRVVKDDNDCYRLVEGDSGDEEGGSECEEDGESVNVSNGILQEYLVYSGSGQTGGNTSSNIEDNALSGAQDTQHQQQHQHQQEVPTCVTESKKEEILSSMADAIWPDIVQAMRPLIRNVLVTASEHNVPYVIQRGQDKGKGKGQGGNGQGYGDFEDGDEYGDGGGGGFDFASDEEGAGCGISGW